MGSRRHRGRHGPRRGLSAEPPHRPRQAADAHGPRPARDVGRAIGRRRRHAKRDRSGAAQGSRDRGQPRRGRIRRGVGTRCRNRQRGASRRPRRGGSYDRRHRDRAASRVPEGERRAAGSSRARARGHLAVLARPGPTQAHVPDAQRGDVRHLPRHGRRRGLLHQRRADAGATCTRARPAGRARSGPWLPSTSGPRSTRSVPASTSSTRSPRSSTGSTVCTRRS